MKSILILLLAFSCVFFSCEKFKEEPRFTDFVQVIKDDAYVQSIFDDVQSITEVEHASSQENALEKQYNQDLPTVTVDAGENGFADSAWTITIDYGDGIPGRYGWIRKGKIIVDVQGFYRFKGAKRTMSFENYYVNDNKVEGTHTVTNIGFDSTEMAYVFQVTVRDAIVTKTDNTTITWSSDRIRKWTAGYDTPLVISDDVYAVTGSAHGVNSEGKPFTKTIIEPLIIYMNCQYIQDGSIDITVQDTKTASLDFGYSEGAGSCDEHVKLTYNNRDFTFRLR